MPPSSSSPLLPNESATIGSDVRSYDLHLHTSYSLDAFSTVEQVLERARRLKIGLAITDHSEIRGAVAALEQSRDVEIIPAIEVKALNGVDIMVYFKSGDDMVQYYQRVVEPKRQGLSVFVPDLTEREIVDGARQYEAIVSAPHPYAPGRMGLAGVVDSGRIRPDLLENMDAIETANGMMSHATNAQAEILAKRLKKPVLGGSDAHLPGFIGHALTLVPANLPLLDAIRQGRTRTQGGGQNQLISAAVFFLGQGKIMLQPNGWQIFRKNLAVYNNKALRDGTIKEA